MTDRWIRQVTPRLAVVVDESLCICLRAPGAADYTISNVDALVDALNAARTFVRTTEQAARS